jgi:hypothetical protein
MLFAFPQARTDIRQLAKRFSSSMLNITPEQYLHCGSLQASRLMLRSSNCHQIGCHFPPLRSSSGADGVNRVSYQDRNAGRDCDD